MGSFKEEKINDLKNSNVKTFLVSDKNNLAKFVKQKLESNNLEANF